VWQLYHYDLEPNAALYGAKKAAESVHVQFNEENRGIEVVNNRPDTLKGMKVRLRVYQFDGKQDEMQWYKVAEVPGSSTIKVAQIEVSARISPLYFIKLDLIADSGEVVSTNFYWEHVAQDQFDGLEKLPTVALDATAQTRIEGEKTVLTVTLQNNTKQVALLTHLQLHQKKSGRRVLPVFYSDNYISLVPGESSTLTIEAATKDLQDDEPLVEVDGYNVDVKPVDGPVSIALNVNAQPSHWPASNIVP
jgi:beta-mannosidase